MNVKVSLAMIGSVLLGAAAPSASAQNAFFTTGDYTLNAAHSVAGNAFVGYDSNFSPTDSMGNPYNPTVNLVTDGTVSNRLDAFNSSMVNISGGSINNGLVVHDSSTTTISGGSIANGLATFNSSMVNISGGSISGGVGTYNNSMVNVSGGSISGVFQANDTSVVNISGGSINDTLTAYNNSAITISGGTFGPDAGIGQMPGINFYDLTTNFTLVGSNLAVSNPRQHPFFLGTEYDLSGTLQGGTNLRGYVLYVNTGSSFRLENTPAAVPEPGSVALLAVIGVSGGVFTIRRRRARI